MSDVHVERVDATMRGRYRQLRLEGLYRRHHRLAARLHRKGFTALEVEDALEDAERERILDLVGLDHGAGEDDE